MVESPLPIEGEIKVFPSRQFGKGLRSARRYRCGLATFGIIQFPGGADSREAFVLNISKTGIGLRMAQPLEVGQDLTLRLRVSGEPTPRVFALTTIHSTQEADRSWRVGCEFAEPLSADLLEMLLQ